MSWEYKIVHLDDELRRSGFTGNTIQERVAIEKLLNQYGQEGWELVSLVPDNIDPMTGAAGTAVAHFKRKNR